MTGRAPVGLADAEAAGARGPPVGAVPGRFRRRRAAPALAAAGRGRRRQILPARLERAAGGTALKHTLLQLENPE